MSTETIRTTPQPAPAPGSRTDLQQAMNANWKAVNTTATDPFFTGQKTWGRDGAYVAEIGYLLLEPVLEIAAAYDVPVTETPAAAGGTTYRAVVPVDGVDVHIWTTNPTDATAVEG